MIRACAALLGAASLSACGSTLAAGGPPPPASPLVQLRQDINTLLADPRLERGTWGLSIQSLDRGDTLYALNPRKLLIPGSVMKVVTLAAAAERLGWTYTYDTQMAVHGAIDFGFLDGDLVVVGSGDPSIDDWDGAASRSFRIWADQLKAAGVRTVGGRMIGDDNTFDDTGLGAGWAWDDLAASYATSVGALQFNENTAQVIFTPGAAAGEPAHAVISPGYATVTLRNLIFTAPSGAPPLMTLRPAPRGAAVEARGTIGLNAPAVVRNVSVENPTLYFLAAMRDGLIANGIDVRGAPVDIDDMANAPSRQEGTVVLTHRSPPLSRLAETMMKWSQNLYAETLLKTLGAQATGAGSVEAGRAAVNVTLQAWGIPAGHVQMTDGSGLSRYNLITSDALVMVLTRVYRDEHLRGAFERALPIAGVDGTLAKRMKGTKAAANVRAKTGSLSNARAIAGYVRTAEGEALAFSIIANNYAVPTDLVDTTADGIITALAGFSRK
jgi:serine-type D-Ala-D-Ala carboxypeptidase/endopeptidase (penicillin-binding protein 4)